MIKEHDRIVLTEPVPDVLEELARGGARFAKAGDKLPALFFRSVPFVAGEVEMTFAVNDLALFEV